MWERARLLSWRYGFTDLWRFHLASVPKILHVVPIFFAVVAFVLFATVGQLHEIYLIAIENDDRHRFALGLALLTLLAAALSTSYLELTERRAQIVYGGTAVQLTPALLITRNALALLCGLAPLLGVVYGVWSVQTTMARTIYSAWEATRTLPSGGPLSIPVQLVAGDTAIFASSLWRWSVTVVGILAMFLAIIWAAVPPMRSVGLWAHIRANLPALCLTALGVLLAVSAISVVLSYAPRSIEPNKEIPLASLFTIGQFYLGAAFATVFLYAGAFVLVRNSEHPVRVVRVACIAVVVVTLLILPTQSPAVLVKVTRLVGPLAMVATQFLTVLTLFLALYLLARQFRISFVVLILLPILLRVGWLSLEPSEPHKAFAQPDRTSPSGEPRVVQDFRTWMENRQDLRGHFKEFPVFVIAAQGGGIYAASAAATFLSRMQDQCPAFARHVFAISGVSGGAVGSALFNATLEGPPTPKDLARPPPPECTLPAAADPRDTLLTVAQGRRPTQSESLRWVLTQDHLSPVLAMLTPEYFDKLTFSALSRLHRVVTGGRSVDRHLVWNAIDQFDSVGFDVIVEPRLTRAKALEASLACAVNTRPRSRTLKRCAAPAIREGLGPYADQFKHHAARPALLLNTTFVETGQRVSFSPFPLKDLNDKLLLSFSDLQFQHDSPDGTDDTTLAEAAVASARFPGLMPALALDSPLKTNQTWNFVDGGYADNSGAATATAVAAAINDQAKRMGARVRLLILTEEELDPNLDKTNGTLLVDTVAPVRALLKVRSSLAAREVAGAITRLGKEWQKLGDQARAAEDWNVGVVRLDETNFSLQLGWTLSRTTNLIVSLFVAKSEYCDHPVYPKRLQRADKRSTPDDKKGPTTSEPLPKSDELAKAQEDARLMTRNACLLRDTLNLMRPDQR